MTTTWREELTEEMTKWGETMADIVASTLSEAELDRSFNNDYGFKGIQGAPFTVWTADRVYFPVCHDGAEWVASVQRNPDKMLPTEHIGGN